MTGDSIGACLRRNPRPSGFDCLRIGLALAVIAWHTILICYGRSAETPYWMGPLRPLIYLIVPSFFALSGFLVAGSMDRNTPAVFLWFRSVRIFPALAVEVTLSALVLGLLFSTLSFQEYVTHPDFAAYFQNSVGIIHYTLPGVFEDNPNNQVNAQLWTIPFEFICYVALLGLWILGAFLKPRLMVAMMLLTPVVLIPWYYWRQEFGAIDNRPGMGLVVGAFFAGVLIYKLKEEIPLRASWALVAAVACWLLLYQNGTELLALGPMAYVTVFLGTRNPKIAAVQSLADYSYGVYIYGFPVQQAVFLTVPWARVPWTNFLLSAAIVTVFAALSWHFVERPLLVRRKLYWQTMANVLDTLEKFLSVNSWSFGRGSSSAKRGAPNKVSPGGDAV